MSTALYLIGMLGLTAAGLAVFTVVGQQHDYFYWPMVLSGALGSVLILGFGRVIEMLEFIDRTLKAANPSANTTAPAMTPAAAEGEHEVKHYSYGDLSIDALDDGSYTVRGPGMEPRRFKSKQSLDTFLQDFPER